MTRLQWGVTLAQDVRSRKDRENLALRSIASDATGSLSSQLIKKTFCPNRSIVTAVKVCASGLLGHSRYDRHDPKTFSDAYSRPVSETHEQITGERNGRSE